MCSVRPAIDDDGREQLSENKLATPESPVIVERVQQPPSSNSRLHCQSV